MRVYKRNFLFPATVNITFNSGENLEIDFIKGDISVTPTVSSRDWLDLFRPTT